jgi:hypothetical protein
MFSIFINQRQQHFIEKITEAICLDKDIDRELKNEPKPWKFKSTIFADTKIYCYFIHGEPSRLENTLGCLVYPDNLSTTKNTFFQKRINLSNGGRQKQ